MKNQLIFEIGTEEIPAGYLLPALGELKGNMAQSLADLRLTSREINGAATPRRLVICVEDLLARQPDRTEEILGPPKKAAFDPAGNPTKAAIGFARSRGVSIADIKIANTPKGEYLLIRQEQKGRPTEELMVELLPELLKSISFPKSMHWGEARTSFARPIQWLLALYNGAVIPFTVDGVGDSADVTYGHRFMAPGAIKIKDYRQYLDALRVSYVLADPQERKEAVLREINRVAQKSGGRILPDDDLLATVANLVESPHAILGVFEEKFLALPKDALITSMREHQKYFAIVDEEGRLRPNFIAVNNTEVKDEGLGAEGHQRVLRARLEDGLFFFRKDLKRKLAERVKDLDGLIFQARLGSMREKTNRIQALAGLLAQDLAPDMVEDSKRAAYLAKADLLTEMVNEFPSLQGLMGRDYAALDGEKPSVAEAIAEHYMPIRAGSGLPTGILGALIGMADRLDTIA
ncbi:MAG: glycine--tRNA ligase subunit beta, partial [Deltaproteobacteria bacterium]|nr:glycine--tRNA ligase subunit beta [Deltaproteobacteria bacterium]